MDEIKLTPTIQCPCCGAGEVALPRTHLGVWRAIYRTPCIVDDLASRFHVKHTTMNNRLEFLRKHGLAGRAKDGKRYTYWGIYR